jgi:hypothetical protein
MNPLGTQAENDAPYVFPAITTLRNVVLLTMDYSTIPVLSILVDIVVRAAAATVVYVKMGSAARNSA